MAKLTDRVRKGLSIGFLILFLVAFVLITVFLGKPLLKLFEEPEVFRAWVEEKGWSARILFVGMVVFQVIVALIPGEPLEIAAGFAFGSLEGTLLCMAGIALGSLLVFCLVRSLGVKLVEVFFPVEKIHSLRFLQNSRRVEILLFLIMLIPGTPKDLISYFVGLTEMKLSRWVVLTTVARIPSVVTSTVGGNALGEGQYLFAVIVFAVSIAISLAGLAIYDRITRKKEEKKGE
ncbi:MAG: TVP38/TMEM64 family protein [Clostridia bacterium]|nr:TVP38/TMEM64 family protein [Clostridia bacterium]